MKSKLFIISVVAFLLIFSINGFSGGVGTTSGAFTKIPTTSRIIGMAEAFTAVIDDPSALSINPGGLGNIDNMELLFSHYAWISSINYEYLAFAKPSFKGFGGEEGVLAASISYLHLPTFFHYDDWGESIGNITYGGLVVTAGYGQKLKNFTIGNAIKMIREDIDGDAAFAWAIDLGATYTAKLPPSRIAGFNLKGKSLKFGFSLMNISIDKGAGERLLPLMLKLGVGSKLGKGFLLDLDFEKPFDNRVRLNLGAEYTIHDIVSFRAGYRFIGYETDSFTLGLGVAYKFGDKLVRAGTAYAPQGAFKDTSNFTISMKFPGGISAADWKLANTLYYKGIYYYTKGEIDKAITMWKECLKIVPDFEKAKQKLKDAEYLKKLKSIEEGEEE